MDKEDPMKNEMAKAAVAVAYTEHKRTEKQLKETQNSVPNTTTEEPSKNPSSAAFQNPRSSNRDADADCKPEMRLDQGEKGDGPSNKKIGKADHVDGTTDVTSQVLNALLSGITHLNAWTLTIVSGDPDFAA